MPATVSIFNKSFPLDEAHMTMLSVKYQISYRANKWKFRCQIFDRFIYSNPNNRNIQIVSTAFVEFEGKPWNNL